MNFFEDKNEHGSLSTVPSSSYGSKLLKVNAIESASRDAVSALSVYEAALKSPELWKSREKMMV